MGTQYSLSGSYQAALSALKQHSEAAQALLVGKREEGDALLAKAHQAMSAVEEECSHIVKVVLAQPSFDYTPIRYLDESKLAMLLSNVRH